MDINNKGTPGSTMLVIYVGPFRSTSLVLMRGFWLAEKPARWLGGKDRDWWRRGVTSYQKSQTGSDVINECRNKGITIAITIPRDHGHFVTLTWSAGIAPCLGLDTADHSVKGESLAQTIEKGRHFVTLTWGTSIVPCHGKVTSI